MENPFLLLLPHGGNTWRHSRHSSLCSSPLTLFLSPLPDPTAAPPGGSGHLCPGPCACSCGVCINMAAQRLIRTSGDLCSGVPPSAQDSQLRLPSQCNHSFPWSHGWESQYAGFRVSHPKVCLCGIWIAFELKAISAPEL